MGKIMKDLVEYHGIDDLEGEIGGLFKQVEVENFFFIEDNKPDIRYLIKVWAEVKRLNAKVIGASKGTSVDGKNNTGYKLRVIGEGIIKVQYTTGENTQSIHSLKGSHLFCEYLTLPEESTEETYVDIGFKVQDMHIECIHSRCIISHMNLLIVGEIC